MAGWGGVGTRSSELFVYFISHFCPPPLFFDSFFIPSYFPFKMSFLLHAKFPPSVMQHKQHPQTLSLSKCVFRVGTARIVRELGSFLLPFDSDVVWRCFNLSVRPSFFLSSPFSIILFLRVAHMSSRISQLQRGYGTPASIWSSLAFLAQSQLSGRTTQRMTLSLHHLLASMAICPSSFVCAKEQRGTGHVRSRRDLEI